MERKEGLRWRRPASETREHVLRVARELFYWDGIRATGVDRIASTAGVAPTTLYRLFASKDDLVASYVEREDLLYREWFEMSVGAETAHPRERILALFGNLIEQVHPDRCRGCPFQMALSEFPDPDSPVRQRAIDNKSWVREQLGILTEELAENAPVADPSGLADSLALLMEGTYAYAQSLSFEGPPRGVRNAVEMLIAGATTPEE